MTNISRQGSNAVQIRHYNERVVLEAIRRLGIASKAEIARSAHLTPQAVAGIVDALHKAGYLLQTGKRHGQIGQPSVLYAPNPECAFSVGLHVGRRALHAVLVDLSGRVLHQVMHDYAYPLSDEVSQLSLSAIGQLEKALPAKLRSRLIGVGVSMPYFLSNWLDELSFPEAMTESWQGFNLPEFLLKRTKHEVFFENDASAAATAQLVRGRGMAERNFIYFYIGTIIGGGLVLGGNLETGPHGNAAAFNTFPVSVSTLPGVPAPAGRFELLQNRASAYVLLRHLRTNGVKIDRVAELEKPNKKWQPWLGQWEQDCAAAMAQAIIGAVSVVDVEAIVIDGILAPAILKNIVTDVKAQLAVQAPTGLMVPNIREGELGPDGPAIGAALLPFYAKFAPNNEVLATKFRAEAKPLLTSDRVSPLTKI
ncbi:ROK family transcriptional regulator [Acidocella sp.]|uniref:ROK family transcriptional regulator n=1 Tax=Acidocella sp. TaxID=50710 RepID=UPI002638F435|nr:ROK family transcriptional regulator [Acidocella sp.]